MSQRWTPRGPDPEVIATISDGLERLGAPDRAGHAFALTQVALGEECGGSLEKIPRPAYAHGIWLDPRSGNYIVLRPEVDGSFHPVVTNWTRIR